MKKILILLAVLLGLSAVAYYLQQEKSVDLMDTTDRQFAYADRQDIGKIVLNKKGWREQEFEYKKRNWYLNGKKVADYKITTLLKGITSTRVENLPPKEAYPTIKKSIKESGVHVEVYNRKGNKVRSYTIGPDAINDRCTYFMMDGHKTAYCMNIAGFGSVRTRFVQDEEEWWDVALYEVEESDIESIKVEYNKDYTSSFEIKRNAGSYDVVDLGGKTKGQTIDLNKVRAYLSEFRKLNGEGYDNTYMKRDSITKLLPFATISLTERTGDTKWIKLFPIAELMDPADEAFDAEDALILDKYFVEVSTGDFMVAQQRLLQPVLRPYSYFLAEEQ